MEITELHYPVFEANQVLTSAHLNDMFEYLDEQTRLTRADLIGIGIVCGLEASLEAGDAVRLTRGCGVTSQGYLIVEPADVTLRWARTYTLPREVGYQPFMQPGEVPAEQYPMWELLTDQEDAAAVALSTLKLSRMAVVLLLELHQDRGRTCLPNDCDDRGSAVTTTVRRLLMDVDHVKAVISVGRAAGDVPLAVDLERRLALPELRMPRFDVPTTAPSTAEKVLEGFQSVFRREGLVEACAGALSSLYAAFAPLVREDFATDPFTGLRARFGFLDRTPVTAAQVRGLQHHYDLFADLIGAYDEVRRAGLDLVCACCPPQGLFPRHVVAGVLAPTAWDAFEYRTRFVPSPSVSGCAGRARDVRTLFRRLVAMIERFSDAPASKGIRITPSRSAAPLSHKAIPYYYAQQGFGSPGSPPLYRLWDPAKTSQGRPELNLSYRSDEYVPAAPAFVTDPLRYDLEPNDFLRVEGHIGADVRTALESLLAQQKRSRVPIDVIALRTGTFDESIEIDLTKERCRFQDIETLYETLKAELECFLVTQTEYFYLLPLPGKKPRGRPDMTLDLAPSLPLLRARAATLKAEPGTLGHGIESLLTWKPGTPRPFDFDIAEIPHFPSQATALTLAMSRLSEVLTDDLRDLDFEEFDARYSALVDIARQMEDARAQKIFDEPGGLSARLDDIVFRCRRDPFDALAEEYKRRVREVKQEQFLGNFLERHPGIQHKGGVPVGGTFILVYHERPARRPFGPRTRGPRFLGVDEPLRAVFDDAVFARPGATVVRPVDEELLARAGESVLRRADEDEPLDAGTTQIDLGAAADIATLSPDAAAAEKLRVVFQRLNDRKELREDADFQTLLTVMPGLFPFAPIVLPGPARVYADAVAGLADGTVIADFFLPYVCRSNCPPIQYQLPPARLRPTVSKSCTNLLDLSAVTVSAEGAVGALSVKVDDGEFTELENPLQLGVGEHTIVVRDAAGSEAEPLTVKIPPRLAIRQVETSVDEARGTYRVMFTVAGGTPPYLADPEGLADATYTSPDVAIADPLTVTVTDAAGCTVSETFDSGVTPCTYACGGDAVSEGFRFWMPEPRDRAPVNGLVVEVGEFVVLYPDNVKLDVSDAVRRVLAKQPRSMPVERFRERVDGWLAAIEEAIAEVLEPVGAAPGEHWLRLRYEPAPEGGSTGTLHVERLDCVRFRFALNVSFSQRGAKQQLGTRYEPGSATHSDQIARTEFDLRSFDPATANWCRGEDWVRECDGEAQLELDFEQNGLNFAATVGAGDEPVRFLWEIEDGRPAAAGGAEFDLRGFEPMDPPVKRVRLTIITERGCTKSVEKSIEVG